MGILAPGRGRHPTACQAGLPKTVGLARSACRSASIVANPMSLSRSQQMSRIKGRDTSPEQELASALWRHGLRYRRHHLTLAGRPDFVFSGKRVAVYVDGCQWHGCPAHYVPPRSNIAFWANKLATNVARDHSQTAALEAQGWRVLRLWECEIILGIDVSVSRVLDVLTTPTTRFLPDWRVFRIEWLDRKRDLERRWMHELRDPGNVRSEERTRTTGKARHSNKRALR